VKRRDYGKGLSVSDDAGMALRKRPSKSPFVWVLAALVLLILGTLGSDLGAHGVANSISQRNERAFLASSSEIASTLKAAIQHEQDLIGSTESFLTGNPDATQQQFTAWSKDLHVLRNYPDLTGLGVIDYVTAAQLPAYERRVSLATGKSFTVTPAGKRPYYCLAPLGLSRPGAQGLANGTDFCDGPVSSYITSPRSSGKSLVLPYRFLGQETIALETPIYRGGAVPTTVAARERAFVEVIGLNLVPNVILKNALTGHPGTAVALSFDSLAPTLTFQSGTTPKNARTTTVDLHDGWSVETFGVQGPHGLLGNGSASLIFFGGIALSALLGVVIFLLGTGRARSMMLVGERTEQLQYQALHDSLTGLPNRALIVDRIEQLLERNREQGTLGAALFVDLDDFKNVNDSLGHEAGDDLLVSVAERMKSTLRGADTIGRMGGDEFVILIDGGKDEIGPDLVARRLLDIMRQPFDIKGALAPLTVNTSIGIAIGDRRNGGELLRDADVALYQAKAAGKNQFVIFSQEMQNDVGRRISLEFDLRSALSGQQYFLVYQPIYNLEDLTIVGVEALLRWRHPSDGVIQPDDFIPILERTGAIREVGSWVLLEACVQMATWHARGDTLDVSVNVSARQLDSDVFVSEIRHALDVSGLSAHSLIIELTETALMLDVDAVVQRLQAIRDLGVRIAIDDFGTGYSSLSHLRQFPVDCIKIDKSFTAAMSTSDESRALVKTFLQLGRDLGLKTLAEGVESIDQMDLLRASDVREVQGFLLSHPLDAHTLEVQLLEPRRLTGTPTPPSVT
jgi:diguanylate cyclase (GGDEF)-like protein